MSGIFDRLLASRAEIEARLGDLRRRFLQRGTDLPDPEPPDPPSPFRPAAGARPVPPPEELVDARGKDAPSRFSSRTAGSSVARPAAGGRRRS